MRGYLNAVLRHRPDLTSTNDVILLFNLAIEELRFIKPDSEEAQLQL